MKIREVKSLKRSDVPSELLVKPKLSLIFWHAIFDWIIIVSCWYLLTVLNPIFSVILIMIIAGRFHALGVLIHDLCHMNLKKKSFLFRIIEILTGYIIGTSANAMAYHHIRHHKNTLLENDPYYQINKKCSGLSRFFLTFKKGLFFVPFWIARSLLAPFAIIFPKLRVPYGKIFLQEVTDENLEESSEILACLKEDIPIAIFHITLFILSFYFEFIKIGIYLVYPIAGVFCIYRLLIEHEYDIVEDRSVYSMIESTFDHHTSFFEKIFIGPHNIGYHCMHHIHPSVSFQALPKLKEWYKENSTQYAHYDNCKKEFWNLGNNPYYTER